MKIDYVLNSDGINLVDAYSEGAVVVSKETYRSSLILCATDIIDDWPPQTCSELTAQHLQQVVSLEPEIVLLGTGLKIVFPEDEILQPITTNRIGYEIMDTGAACRSYNFLVAEGRRVVAALFMIGQ